MSLSLKTVDLFCGCGGMSLGFLRAGYDLVAAVDSWDAALAVHGGNLPTPVTCLDLSDVDAAVEFLRPLDADVIIGGPPCQDFSIAGKRDENGGRASLTLSFADIVTTLEPKCFVMENVYNATRFVTYLAGLDRLRDAGYGVTMKVMDASRMGVPQARKRCFAIGILGESQNSLANELDEHLSATQMTVREYMGDAIDFDHYFVMPRSYARRGIFSVDMPASTIRGMSRPMPDTYVRHPRDTCEPALAHTLTPVERSYLQTFPSWYSWPAGKAAVDQMVGNAVPPNMAEYVARVLRSHLDGGDVGSLTDHTFVGDAMPLA